MNDYKEDIPPEKREELKPSENLETQDPVDEKRMLDEIYAKIKIHFDKNELDDVCCQVNFGASILNNFEATDNTYFFENSIPLVLLSMLETKITEYCCASIDFISQISKYKEDSITECFITPEFIEQYCNILMAEMPDLTSHIIALLEVFGDYSQDFAENLLNFISFPSLTQYFLFSDITPKQKVEVLKMLYINIKNYTSYDKAEEFITFIEEILAIPNESNTNKFILLCLIVTCLNQKNISLVGSSESILQFLDSCLESGSTEIQKYSLILYGLFFSDNNCELPFDFETFANLTEGESEVAQQAMSVFVYACQNPNCFDTLMENNILDFIRGKEDDEYDIKVSASKALTNLVQSLPCEAHAYLFDSGIVGLLLDFHSDCNCILFLKSLYFLFTTPDWVLRKNICLQFDELGGTNIVDEIEEENETDQEICELIDEIRENYTAAVPSE